MFEICKLSSLSLNQALNCPTQSLDEFPARLTEFDAVLPLPPVEQVLLGGRISFVTPGDCAALSPLQISRITVCANSLLAIICPQQVIVAGVLHVVLVELGPASTAFVCNVSEKGDRIHRCMHCSLRKDLRCMHSLFERRRPGHASLFDRGLVSPVRCRKHVLNYRGMLLMDAPNGCVDRNDCIRIDADVFAVLLCSCSLAEICNSSSLVR